MTAINGMRALGRLKTGTRNKTEPSTRPTFLTLA